MRIQAPNFEATGPLWQSVSRSVKLSNRPNIHSSNDMSSWSNSTYTFNVSTY